MKGKKQLKRIVSALVFSALLCLVPIRTQAAWKQVNGSWKWSEGSSYVKSDWRKIGNDWYYFNQNGYALTGWKKIGGYWYYFNSSCKMQTGWQKIGGIWYYFTSNGHMVTGWQQINRVWFYFGSNGHMLTGWQKINGSWYYFEANGHMKTGWLKDGSDWYFLNANGKMAANTWINNTYYMGSNGAMLKNTTTPDGYLVGSDGAWINNKIDWKSAYKYYILNDYLPNKKNYAGDETYQLVYIDNDDIPEVYINGGCTAAGDDLLAIKISDSNNVEVTKVHMYFYGLSYLKKKGMFLETGGHMNGYYNNVYTLSNGTFTKIAYGTYGAENNSKLQYDSNGNVIYKYYWQGKNVSKTTYENSLLKVFNTKNAITPKYEDYKKLTDFLRILN